MRITSRLARGIGALAIAVACGMPATPMAQVGTRAAGPAEAVLDADTRGVLAALSHNLEGLERFSVEYAAVDEVITNDGDRLQFLHSGTILVQRPGRLQAVRRGAAGEARIVLDGAHLWLFGQEPNAYVRIPAASIAAAIDAVRDLGADTPGADLLAPNPFAPETSDIVRGVHIGMTSIDGAEVHHLAFRGAQVDWQLWVTSGDRPLPLRYVVTAKTVAGMPQYTLQLRNWNLAPPGDAAQFAFTPPAGARQVEPGDVTVNAIGDLAIRTR